MKNQTTTDIIRRLIPSWATDIEVERLRNEFRPPIAFDLLKEQMTNPKNWRRAFKDGNLRMFDLKPQDDQVRLYASTDDGVTFKHWFTTE